MRVDTVIVGAGIAGLAAAYELQRHGISFVVLEREARAGTVDDRVEQLPVKREV